MSTVFFNPDSALPRPAETGTATTRRSCAEVLDLTHPPTAKLLFTLLDRDTPLQPSHVDLCKHIRVFKNSPDEVVVSKPGRTAGMGLLFGDEVGEGEDWTNGEVEARPMDLEA